MPFRNPAFILRFQLVVDRNVEVPPIFVVWTTAKFTHDFLASFYGQDIGEVENGLLPMSIFGMWTGAETNRLVTSRKFDVEPCNERMNVIRAANLKLERKGKGKISGGDGVEIEGDDSAGVGNDGLELYCVDQRFRECSDFERSIVKTVDVVPD